MQSIMIHYPDHIDCYSFIVEKVDGDSIQFPDVEWSDCAETLEECIDIIKQHELTKEV